MEGQQLHDRRWMPVKALKNSHVTIQIVCSGSGKRFNVPSGTKKFLASADLMNGNDDCINYYDNDDNESGTAAGIQEELLGSTTLHDLIKRVKKDIPGLYLWDEVGGGLLVCGPNHVFQSEWSTTMLCDLIRDTTKKSRDGSGGGGGGGSTISDETGEPKAIPRVVLEDGREAVVVTIGTPDSILKTKPSVVQRCLAKGDVYG